MKSPILALHLLALTLLADGALADVESGQHTAPFQVLIRVHDESELGLALTQPVSEHRILFHRGVVYDLTSAPKERSRFVTVFDPNQTRVVLLDRQSKVRSTVSTENLVEMTAKARSATQDPEKLEAWGLRAVAQADAAGEQFAIRFGRVTYATSTQRPSDPGVAQAFGGFCDWAARLNIARQVDAPPPFGRMTLNHTLAAAELLPETMTVTFHREQGDARYRVEHQLTPTLSDADLKQIQEIEGMLVAYREVPFKSFPE